MDVAAITQLIGNMGFPIACVIAMFYFWNKEREDHKTEMQKMTDAINNNTLVMTDAINNNTLALTKLESVIENGKS